MSEKIREIFENLEFTEYQSRIMSALIKNNEMTAQEISRESGVPYTKIYSVLGSLENRDYIKSNLERPKKYSTFPPEILCKKIKENKKKELKSLEEYLDSSMDRLKREFSDDEFEDVPIWLCSSRDSLWDEMLSSLVLKAEDEVSIVCYTLWKDLANSEDFLNAFEELKNNGTRVRIVLPRQKASEGEEELSRLRESGVDIRGVDEDEIFYSLVVTDKEKCGLPAKEEIQTKANRALRVNNELLANALYIYFKNLWKKGDRID